MTPDQQAVLAHKVERAGELGRRALGVAYRVFWAVYAVALLALLLRVLLP